jgi:acetyl esterase/lipase
MIPFLAHADKREKHLWDTVTYSGDQKLDIWAPQDPHNAPVMMFIPGGAWCVGSRKHQGYALMDRLVSEGWICVSIDYRTAPQNRWPAPLEDVQAAWAWIEDAIHGYGGGNFTAVAGASAGAHMASLLALRGDSPTSFGADALVSLYGVYSWDSKRLDHLLINKFVETVVVGDDDPEVLRAASPIHQIHRNAPPTLIVHGDRDFITPESGAKAFYNKLSKTSDSPTFYHKVKGGHHAFDLIDSKQTDEAVDVIAGFLNATRRKAEAA